MSTASTHQQTQQRKCLAGIGRLRPATVAAITAFRKRKISAPPGSAEFVAPPQVNYTELSAQRPSIGPLRLPHGFLHRTPMHRSCQAQTLMHVNGCSGTAVFQTTTKKLLHTLGGRETYFCTGNAIPSCTAARKCLLADRRADRTVLVLVQQGDKPCCLGTCRRSSETSQAYRRDSPRASWHQTESH